ncbi:MAG: bacteriophage holin [Candidatus Berkiella sp.]
MNQGNCQHMGCCKRLGVCALGMAIGVAWALGVLFLGILVYKFGYGKAFLDVLASIYVGYAPTPKGIVIGTAFALADGFICGILIAWIYNLCNKICCCCTKACKKDKSPTE